MGLTTDISIHALRVEGDNKIYLTRANTIYFYPRPPGGGRREDYAGNFGQAMISIHALRVEGDRDRRVVDVDRDISIHALRVEGDISPLFGLSFNQISIHALRVEGDTDFATAMPCAL